MNENKIWGMLFVFIYFFFIRKKISTYWFGQICFFFFHFNFILLNHHHFLYRYRYTNTHTHKYPKMTLVNNCSFSMVIIQKYPYMLKIDTMKQNSSIFHFFSLKKTLPQRIFNVNNLYYKIVCKIKPFFSWTHTHTKKQNKTKLNWLYIDTHFIWWYLSFSVFFFFCVFDLSLLMMTMNE